MTVDVERLLSSFLRGRSEIEALVDDRVYTEIPGNPSFPLVRLNQYGGAPVFSRPLYLDTASIQIDCYGGPKLITRTIADTVRQLLADEFIGSHEAGTVTAVVFGEMRYLPDDSYAPAKPRTVVDVSVYSHP